MIFQHSVKMVSGRPLLYMSLPGVAFILGVFWFRHRNKSLLDANTKKAIIDSGGKKICSSKKTEAKEELIIKSSTNGSVKNTVYPHPTQSININGVVASDEQNIIFGKSAPITIAQNGRGTTSPVHQSQQQIDSDILISKIQDVEHKLLRSIDEDFENLSSPVDLPDSVNNRMPFYSRNVNIKKDKPVVIIATTTPKISPENSFMESKYTKECEQNNKIDKMKTVQNVNTDGQVVRTPPSTLSKANEMEKAKLNGITADTVTDVSDSAKKTVIANKTDTDANANEKRNVDSASPSLSLCSVQSGDSGTGSSLPRSEATRAKTTYEFFLPNSLVGHLYGRKRSYINYIKSKTNARVVLHQKLYIDNLRVCAIEGTENEVQSALDLIRKRLPAKRYPNLTLQRIHFGLPQTVVPLSTESLLKLQLNLIEGINNDVVVSAIISGGHLFVQHPLHPTHPSLAILQQCLFDSYNTSEAPLLPGFEQSAVCVMPVNGIWYRVQIVDQDPVENDRCIVKFLDFGGYMNVHFNDLRQIRSDFMSLPFQATECILSNIEPTDTCWSSDSADILSKLTKGIVLQAQVAGYNSQNIPEIYLFACLGPNNFIFINKELVARNLAKWVEVKD